MTEYLKVQEIADELRVSNMTVYRLIHSGELESVKISGSFRVAREALADYLRRNSGRDA